MPFKCSVALQLLLIPAIVGCQSTLPTQPATAGSSQDVARNSPAQTQTAQVKTNQGVIHAGFDQRELPFTRSKDDPGEQKTLTLTVFEEIALQNNPALVVAAAQMATARGKQIQAGKYPNPIVGYHATEIGNLGTAGQQGGFVRQRFMTGGKLWLDQEISGKELDRAHFHFHAQEQRVLSDVRVRFFNALVAQRRLELLKELTHISAEFVQATKKLLQGRLVTENDLLQAKIKSDESHILLDNAHNEHTESWRRLVAVVGMPTMPLTPLAGTLDSDLPCFDWDSCHAMVLGNNPDLHAARAQVERTNIALQRSKKELIPNFDLSVSVRHHNVTESDVANIQLGIPIPIFNQNQGNIWAAKAKRIAACYEVKRIELDLQDRLAVAYRQYLNARQKVERYSQKMIPRAEQALNLVRNGYKTGQLKYQTLLTAQETYLRVNLSHLTSLQELWTASSIIEGQLLTGSLADRR